MVFRAFRRKPPLPPELQELGSTLKEAKKTLAAAEKVHSGTVKSIRKELRDAEREHERAVRASQAELDRRGKERTQRIESAQKRYDSIRATLAPMETARFGKSVLYEDRVVTKQGEALLQRGVTALADTAAKIAIARPGAVARLAASGTVNGRAFRSAQGYDARRFYLLIEAPELVALLPCRAGDEQAAKEFAARVNVAALNARRIEREREETLGDAQHELDAAESHQDAVLAADDELARVVADTDAITLARTRLEEAEADTEAIETHRARVVELEQDYSERLALEQERLAEERRVEEERRLEEKRRLEEERLEEERRAGEARAEAERAAAEAEQHADVDAEPAEAAERSESDDQDSPTSAEPGAEADNAAQADDSEIEGGPAAESGQEGDAEAESEAGDAAVVDAPSDESPAKPDSGPLLETVVVMETVETLVEQRAAEANGEAVSASEPANGDDPELAVGGGGRSTDASSDET